jgi:prepilin-type processing-associated H-X9-DG protein
MLTSRLKTTLTVLLAGFLLAGAGAVGTGLFASGPGEGGSAAPRAEPPSAADNGPGAAPVDRAQEAKLRHESQTNLKHIGLALHNHADTLLTFPPPANRSKNGKPLLSWRVAILPYLDEDNLYKQFKLDEPWDSPHNKKLLPRIPKFYQPVRGPSKVPGGTYYQAFVGKGAAFELELKLRPADFTDGTSNTLMVVEAATPVPWTKPEDLPYVEGQALPALGGQFGGNFNALFADGSVSFLSRDVDRDTLRAAITRNGGEVLDHDKLRPPADGKAGADAQRLRDENRRLREEVEVLKRELDRAAAEVAELQAKVARAKDRHDARAAQVLRENRELMAALEQLRAQLTALRDERARLRKVLEKE